jgi:hypothetical protein
MSGFLNAPRWRRAMRPIAQRIEVHRIYVQREPAWADAWPHLDNWFKLEARIMMRGLSPRCC